MPGFNAIGMDAVGMLSTPAATASKVYASFALTYGVRGKVSASFALAYGVRGTVQRTFALTLAVDAPRTKVQRTFVLNFSVQAAGGGSGIGSAVVPASRTVVFPGGTRYVVF